MNFIIGAIIGLLIIVSLGFLVGLMERILGEKNTSLIIGFITLIGGTMTFLLLKDLISHSLYLYNSIDAFTIVFFAIIGIIALVGFYLSYLYIIKKERFDSPFLLILSILGLYGSFNLSQSLNSEIKPKEYKSINTIYEEVSHNPKTKKLYETIFPEITKDNIVTRKEYKKITRIKEYLNHLEQQVKNQEQTINNNYKKQNYLEEAKQKYMYEKSNN